MPIFKVGKSTTSLVVWPDSNAKNRIIIPFSALTARPNDHKGREAELKILLQNALDKRTLQTDLPVDDPDRTRTTDTDKTWEFVDAETNELVSRAVQIIAVEWHEGRQTYLPRLGHSR